MATLSMEESKDYEYDDEDFQDDDSDVSPRSPASSKSALSPKSPVHVNVMKANVTPPVPTSKPNANGCSARDRKAPKWLALEELERDRTRVSLNRDRVRSITQKLSKLQQGLESDRTRSRTAFESQLKELQAKIQHVEGEQDSRLEECDQQIEHVMEALGQERLARELLDERKTKEAEAIIKSVDLKLEELRTLAASTEEARTSELRDIREQLETEKRLRAETEEKFGVQLFEQVARLTEQVDSYKEQNGLLAERVMSLEAKAKRAEETATTERQAREDYESHVESMLEDLCLKMRNEILAERNDRESMEETLLKLIEETCARVEGGLVAN